MIYRGTVKFGVVELDDGVMLPDGMIVNVETLQELNDGSPKRPGTSLADWADHNAEDWSDRLSSEDVDSFTGRKY